MAKVFRLSRLLFFLALCTLGFLPSLISAQPAGGSGVIIITLDDAIDPNHARYLDRSLDRAEQEGARLVIIRVDTPGGLLSSMRDMVQRILEAKVPVATYVSPAGAHAGSAGAFIVAAGHIAAMAPGTNIGASSPVGGGGEDLPSTIKSKATNDAAALMRSIAEARGRNPAPLEAMVTGAASYTAKEALDGRILDLIATDANDLLAQIHGRTVPLAGGSQIALDTAGVSCIEPLRLCGQERLTWFERFIRFIADPNVTSLLLSFGSLGILIELYSPGLVIPGVAGAIMIALAFIAFGNLPVNWAGVGLVALGVILAAVELHLPGFGVFGVSAVLALIFGLLFLFAPFTGGTPNFSGPDIRVSPWLIGGVSGGIGALLIATGFLAVRGKRTSPERVIPSDARTVVGQTARVKRALDPVGTVYVADEEWSAEAVDRSHIERDVEVKVVSVEGLTLKVRPVQKG